MLYKCPALIQNWTHEINCATLETPSDDFIIRTLGIIIFGIIAIEILFRILALALSKSTEQPATHPLFLEFSLKSYLALIVVTKGLYNTYFSLISLAALIATLPISWTISKTIQVIYFVALLGALLQWAVVSSVGMHTLQSYVSDVACSDFSNWNYYFSFVVFGLALIGYEIIFFKPKS
jgi:hypothetical protein